jgi:5-epi-alpha-selinene synthase
MNLSISHPAFFCPFPSALSPHADSVEQHLMAWVQNFQLMTQEQASRRLHRLKYGWLIACAYPHASLEDLQIVADWTTWLFVLDDQCDETGLGRNPRQLAEVHEAILAILGGAPITHPLAPSPRGLHNLRERMLQQASLAWLQRFIKTVADYFAATAWESTNRAQGMIPDIASYLDKRPFTGGLYMFFDMIELVEHLQLPEIVRVHPTVRRMTQIAANVVCWCNDVISFEKEIQRGDIHNLVPILQHECGFTLQEAIDHVAEMSDTEVRAFVELEARLPSFGPTADADLQRYVAGLRSWMRANLDWSAITDRYHPIAQALGESAETISSA